MNLWSEFEKRITEASHASELEKISMELFGRKSGLMTIAIGNLKNLPDEDRKQSAKELNEWKKKLSYGIDSRNKELGSSIPEDTFDITLELPKKERGHLHLVPEFIRKVEEVFGRMGFDTAYGPEIESEEMNFTRLNIPEHHPARDAQDTFWIKGMEKTVLRTHTSPVQIRYMQERQPPFRMICPGKVYRKDADATHSPVFHQFEGLMIGEDVSLANMKAVMETAVCELISDNANFRWRTGYFPFVEPGLEMDMRWEDESSKTREGKWLEIAGCGMVHPNVLKNAGIDPFRFQGFAFGFGVERMLMLKHRIPDLRAFFEGDLEFLKQF